MILTRRHTSMLMLASLAACQSGGGANTQQILADIEASFQSLVAVDTTIVRLYPDVIPASAQPKIEAFLGAGIDLLQQVKSNLSDAQLWRQIEADLNAALNILASLPIPPPYSLAIAAAAVLAPEIEAIINSRIEQPPAAKAIRTKHNLNVEQARAIVRDRANRGFPAR